MGRWGSVPFPLADVGFGAKVASGESVTGVSPSTGQPVSHIAHSTLQQALAQRHEVSPFARISSAPQKGAHPQKPVPFRNASLQVVGGLVALRVAWDDAAGDCLAGLSGDEEAVVGPGVAAASAGGQGRRTSCSAARERGAAQATCRSGALRAGVPAVVRGVVLVDTPASLGAGVPGNSGHRAGVASKARGTPVGLQQAPEQARPATDHEDDQRAGAAAGRRESALGVSQDPRRARAARASGRSLHGLGDLDCCRSRPCSP